MDINCTVKKGFAISRNPDRKSLPDFNCAVPNYVNVTVKSRDTFINVDLDEAFLSAKISFHTPWAARNGEGPMGILEKLPLPLYWFVYSLASRVTEYTFIDKRNNKRITNSGGNVFAHMEKNWGSSFPSGWIWAQGFAYKRRKHNQKQKSINSVFALEYGPISLFGFEVIV